MSPAPGGHGRPPPPELVRCGDARLLRAPEPLGCRDDAPAARPLMTRSTANRTASTANRTTHPTASLGPPPQLPHGVERLSPARRTLSWAVRGTFPPARRDRSPRADENPPAAIRDTPPPRARIPPRRSENAPPARTESASSDPRLVSGADRIRPRRSEIGAPARTESARDDPRSPPLLARLPPPSGGLGARRRLGMLPRPGQIPSPRVGDGARPCAPFHTTGRPIDRRRSPIAAPRPRETSRHPPTSLAIPLDMPRV
jgi:hypothetical protein